MKKFLNIFFVTLGVIFFVIILISVYLYITDPYDLKPIIFGSETETVESTSDSVDKNPRLNESQEAALETFGIDPAAVPTQITAEQEACFEDKLGGERVAEIKAGDAPTATEYFTARDCI